MSNRSKLKFLYIFTTIFFVAWQFLWITKHSSIGIDEAKHLQAAYDIKQEIDNNGIIAGIKYSWYQSYDYPPLLRLTASFLFNGSVDSLYFSQIIWTIIIILSFYIYGNYIRNLYESYIALILILCSPGVLKYLREFFPDGAMLSTMSLSYLGFFIITKNKKKIYSYISYVLLALPFLVRQTALIFTLPLLLIIILKSIFLFNKKEIFHLITGIIIFILIIISWYWCSLPHQFDVFVYHSQAGDLKQINQSKIITWIKQLFSNQCGALIFITICIGIFFYIIDNISKKKFREIITYFIILFIPIIIFYSFPNKEYRFTLPLIIIISMIAANGYHRYWKNIYVKVIVISLIIMSFMYMIFITTPLEKRNQRLRINLNKLNINVIFGQEIVFHSFEKNCSKNEKNIRKLYIIQPDLHTVPNWRISDILLDINRHISQRQYDVLWLASHVHTSDSIAKFYKNILKIKNMRIKRPWPLVNKPLTDEFLKNQDAVVIGPIHRICYNIPWGRELSSAQMRSIQFLSDKNISYFEYNLPNHQKIDIYINHDAKKHLTQKFLYIDIHRN